MVERVARPAKLSGQCPKERGAFGLDLGADRCEAAAHSAPPAMGIPLDE